MEGSVILENIHKKCEFSKFDLCHGVRNKTATKLSFGPEGKAGWVVGCFCGEIEEELWSLENLPSRW